MPHRRERAGTALSLQVGFVTTFLMVVVVLPIAAIVSEVDRQRLVGLLGRRLVPAGRRGAQADDGRLDAAVLTTAVFGTIIAWVLVRDDFAGKSVVNAIIDLPFALPTIVAGLVIMALYGPRTPIDVTIGSFHFDTNVTFTRGAIYVALLFVTLPFRRPHAAARS